MKMRCLASLTVLLAGIFAGMVYAEDEKVAPSLIPNGDLIPGKTGNMPHWNGWAFQIRPLEEDGTKFCRLVLPEGKANGWLSSAAFAMKPGKEYYFAFRVRKSGECRLIPFIVLFEQNNPKKINLPVAFFTAADGIRPMPEWTEFFGTVKVPEKFKINSGYVHFYADRNQENKVKFASTDEKQIDLSTVQLREL